MRLEIIMKTARSITLKAADGGIYYTKGCYEIWVNGEKYGQTDNVVFSIYNLKPQTLYEIQLSEDNVLFFEPIVVETEEESVTLDVRRMGAAGDGKQDDTLFLQTAILACPPKGRVLIPKGTYRVVSLFLKSYISIELAKGAVLLGDTIPEHRPVLPGMVESYDEKTEYNFGTWEGNPLNMYAAVLNGIEVKEVRIYGEGCVDGQGSYENWWKESKEKKSMFRPRLLFFNRCNHVEVEGILLKNSPSWTIHPYFSSHLKFCNLTIKNPKDSPNTDGLNPESCEEVRIEGVHFDVGDDCIAIKSGKIYMGKTFRTPSKNIIISQCYMENGHGAVTIGSEMAGGVKNVVVKYCYFYKTDRGLRIKTRRGRGKDGMIDHIRFETVRMEEVLTPIVVNCFYFCDPDGKSTYVQSRQAQPIDERTPSIGSLQFHDICCEDCHYAAVYVEGLPELKIRELVLHQVSFQFAEHAKLGKPIMSVGVEACSKRGCVFYNVDCLKLEQVSVLGAIGEPFCFHDVNQIEKSYL